MKPPIVVTCASCQQKNRVSREVVSVARCGRCMASLSREFIDAMAAESRAKRENGGGDLMGHLWDVAADILKKN